MRKKMPKKKQEDRPRVLARILAEDLRNIRVVGGAATTQETGTRGRDDWDMTNVGGDGDVYSY